MNDMKTEPTEALKFLDVTRLNPIHEIPRYRAELAAKIAFQEGQSSPKIKKLEWVEVYKSIFNADSSFKYAYEIHVNDDGSTILFNSSARKPKRFINLKDAKAAAQADFERRVKECLE